MIIYLVYHKINVLFPKFDNHEGLYRLMACNPYMITSMFYPKKKDQLPTKLYDNLDESVIIHAYELARCLSNPNDYLYQFYYSYDLSLNQCLVGTFMGQTPFIVQSIQFPAYTVALIESLFSATL